MPKTIKPVVQFRNRGIYKITPRLSGEPFIIQWIGADTLIDFNNKEYIVGRKVLVKYQFISEARNPGAPILGNNLNTPISLNNIKQVEETKLEIGNVYPVGDRNLILRGFINNNFYVSEDPYTNNYETYHNVPIDEKKQIFRVPITAL